MARKKRHKFFGNNISPSCNYCINRAENGEDECILHLCIGLDGKCKSFIYDPLMREPMQERTLDTFDFTLEDFKL